MTLAPDYWTTAKAVCTPKEIAALELRQFGYGSRLIALTLGISRASARERLENADRKITVALADRHNASTTEPEAA